MSGLILLPAYLLCTVALIAGGVSAFATLTERRPPPPPPRPRGFTPVVIPGGKSPRETP